jgi:hypothetical protein
MIIRTMSSAAVKSWHRWFAWHPVRVSPDQAAWLEVVERRECGSCDCEYWEYRLAEPRVYTHLRDRP